MTCRAVECARAGYAPGIKEIKPNGSAATMIMPG